MRAAAALFSLGALVVPSVLGAPGIGKASPLSKRFDSADSPETWDDNFSLSTNWYMEAPDTGVIREYWWDVTNTTAAPDGFERMVLAVNGTVPGPPIIADWGDTVVIHVRNMMENNGTSIHFHGIRQNRTSENDGVASITQCPTAPGDSITYRWRATQYGSTWYHSHFSLQAWNGVFGGIQINGPASAPYDEDKGLLLLSDWFHRTTDELYLAASSGGAPTASNGLINGTNVYDDGGSRFQTTVTGGNRYRFRLVNTAMDTFFKFAVDNHTMQVIASDLVPIQPYTTDVLGIGIGQRYDVIIDMDQTPGNYWMRAVPQLSCSANEMTLNIRGVLNYDSVDMADPTTEAYNYGDDCNDEAASDLVPYVEMDVDPADTFTTFDVGLNTPNGLFKWTVNNSTFLSDWATPSMFSVWSRREPVLTIF